MPNGQYKFLFQDGSELKKYDINNLSWLVVGAFPASKDLFISEGMDDLSVIDDEALQQLNSDNPELLCWVDDIEIESIQTKIKAVPKPKLIIPLYDIDIKGELQNLILQIHETFTYSENVIPMMTSNNTPYGIASASSSDYDNQPWRAFDKNINTYWSAQITRYPPHWIAYEFTESKIISKYSITNTQYSNAPQEWRFEGTNDDVNWVILDYQTNQINWGPYEKKSFIFYNDVPYKKYRLYITKENGSYCRISEIEMMEVISKPILRIVASPDSGNTWYSFKGGFWQYINISDLNNVKNYGMTPSELNSINQNNWNTFSSSNKVRLAYYIELNNTSEDVQIQLLKSVENIPLQTPRINSINIIYDALDKKYSGLMFMDTSQQYYSTSFGEILKYLDFGTMISGQTSLDVKVYLTNTLPFDVKNIRIYPEHNIDGLTVELSKSNMPFIAENELFYDQVLGFDEVIEFYVRLTTDKDKVGGGTFDIKVKADTV